MTTAVERAGMVQAVTGLLDPSTLGVTMPHEHLFVDVTCMFDPPTEASDCRCALRSIAACLSSKPDADNRQINTQDDAKRLMSLPQYVR